MDQILDSTAGLFADTEGWAAMLRRCGKVFSAIEPGGRIGVIAAGSLAGALARYDGDIMVWAIKEDGLEVAYRPYVAGEQMADILFVVDDQVLGGLHNASEENLSGRLSARSKGGKMMLYFLIGRDDLEDAGYFEFLETVGLSFLGPCR
ncbi:MAG: hypothetical protein HOO19_07060 [Rhodospirillaceae bacterium]|jgi:hypothetical protein|nr:hypothetical protein [Rhodospirillaceae bacterium]MBT3886878.1 hypothetical protein [Rhodospirillaceae bacterium]MBT4118465.1 hypothetical protein [Rhodospirillaceae bacterium]MBT4673807.1 hypothetical protein [Rhodospirillaceae bacterium]MBT4721122.1 hypothetical protein [Rhodospirillaceae bacterium]